MSSGRAPGYQKSLCATETSDPGTRGPHIPGDIRRAEKRTLVPVSEWGSSPAAPSNISPAPQISSGVSDARLQKTRRPKGRKNLQKNENDPPENTGFPKETDVRGWTSIRPVFRF